MYNCCNLVYLTTNVYKASYQSLVNVRTITVSHHKLYPRKKNSNLTNFSNSFDENVSYKVLNESVNKNKLNKTIHEQHYIKGVGENLNSGNIDTHLKNEDNSKQSCDNICKLFLDRIKMEGAELETVRFTNYGSIRLDSENTNNNNNNKNSNKNNMLIVQPNYIDECYFKDNLDKSSENFTKEQCKSNEINSEESETLTDLNYIDKQLFNDDVQNCTTKTSNINSDLVQGESNNYLSSYELNYFDKDYFKTYIKYYDYHNTKDLGYFDFALFNVDDDILQKFPISPTVNIHDNLLFKKKTKSELDLVSSAITDVTSTVDTLQSLNEVSVQNDHKEPPEIIENKEPDVSNEITHPPTSYDYVVELRKKKKQEMYSAELPITGYKRIINSIIRLNQMTRAEIIMYLSSTIVYNDNDIVGLYKPFGMMAHRDQKYKGTQTILTDLLPELAQKLEVEKLYPIHRLDADTTGVCLLAKTPEMANTLKLMFKERRVKKSYYAITKNIPNPKEGLIDIPVIEGKIENIFRMSLRPDIDGIKNRTDFNKSLKAVTKYKVLSHVNSCALVELNPVTGVKHQIRVHLGFGLDCPILGDHKYSNLRKLVPQKLPGDMLDHLKLPQSKVRDLPMCLHAASIFLPEINGKNILIKARLPIFFIKTLKMLNLTKTKHFTDKKLASLVIPTT